MNSILLQETLVVLYDPKRNIFCSLVVGGILLYRPRNDDEVKKMKSLRTVITARLIPTVISYSLESYDKAEEEIRKEAHKIIGKKVKDVKIGDDGIDLVLEDGTTLEIYCFGEWGWYIDKEENQEQEPLDDDALL